MSDDKIRKVIKKVSDSNTEVNQNIEETSNSNKPSALKKDNFNQIDTNKTANNNVEIGDSLIEVFTNNNNEDDKPSNFKKYNINPLIKNVSKSNNEVADNVQATSNSNKPSNFKNDNFNQRDTRKNTDYNIEFGDNILEVLKNSNKQDDKPSTSKNYDNNQTCIKKYSLYNSEFNNSLVEVFKYSKRENNSSNNYLNTAEASTSKDPRETADQIFKASVKDHPFLIPDNKDADHNTTASNHNDANTIKKCTTVKEILSEILDCKVLQKNAVPDDKTIIPEHRTVNNNYGTNRTVKEILGEILDYTICRKTTESQSNQAEMAISMPETFTRSTMETLDNTGKPSTSTSYSEFKESHSEVGVGFREFQIYRAVDTKTINSDSTIDTIKHLPKAASSKSLKRVLPSYSAVMKMGPNPLIKPIESCISFIPRPPPPTYAEVEGIWEDRPSIISSESLIFGPDPIYMVCPRCRVVVVTNVERENSNMTHLIALILCICFCWPFCLVPYCLKSCSYSYHTCPNCQHYFGMYRPF